VPSDSKNNIADFTKQAEKLSTGKNPNKRFFYFFFLNNFNKLILQTPQKQGEIAIFKNTMCYNVCKNPKRAAL